MYLLFQHTLTVETVKYWSIGKKLMFHEGKISSHIKIHDKLQTRMVLQKYNNQTKYKMLSKDLAIIEESKYPDRHTTRSMSKSNINLLAFYEKDNETKVVPKILFKFSLQSLK